MRGLILFLATIATMAGSVVPLASAGEAVTRHVLATPRDGGPGYSIAIPGSIARRPAQGVDSVVAWFQGEGIDLSFDYGWYSAILSCADAPTGCVERRETIGGREAKVVETDWPSGENGPYRRYVALLFELGGPDRLSARARCLDASACTRALAFLRTIEFGTVEPPLPPPPVSGREPSCRRVSPEAARAFAWLEPLLEANSDRGYGRRRSVRCRPMEDGTGVCTVGLPSEIRIEHADGRTSGHVAAKATILLGAGEVRCGADL